MHLPGLCIVTVPVLLFLSCSHTSITERYGKEAYELRGTMHVDKSLEGGCWFLLTADSVSFEPLGEKTADLRKDGMRVVLAVSDTANVRTFCMSGKFVKVLDILEVQTPQ